MNSKVTISEVTSYLVEAQDEDQAKLLTHIVEAQDVLSRDAHIVEVKALVNEGVNIAETYNYTFPAHALSALINGDYSGLDDVDEAYLQVFLQRESHIDHWDVKSDATYFSKYPEFGLACDCVDVVGIVWEIKTERKKS